MVDRRLEVMGFTPENIQEYVKKFFIALVGAEQATTKANQLNRLLSSHPHLQHTACIPINLELICSVWEKQSDMEFNGLASLYQKILEQLLRRYLEIYHRKSTRHLTAGDVLVDLASKPVLEFLELLAYRGMQQAGIILSSALVSEVYTIVRNRYKLEPTFFDWIRATGFLKSTAQGEHELNKDYYFIHLSFQEFFAARYQLTTGLRERQEFIAAYKYHDRFALVMRFMAGLLSNDKTPDAEKPFQHFWYTLNAAPRDFVGVRHLQLIMQCLEESREDKRIPNYVEHCRVIDHCLDVNGEHNKNRNETNKVFYRNTLLALLKQNPWVCRQSNYLSKLLLDRNSWALGELGVAAATDTVIKALVEWLDSKYHELRQNSEDTRRANEDYERHFRVEYNLKKIKECWRKKDQLYHEFRHIAKALGTLGATAATDIVIKTLVAKLEDEERLVRYVVVEALGKLDATTATDTLINALVAKLDDKEVCMHAAVALGKLAVNTFIKSLVVRLEDKNDSARMHAVQMLGKIISLIYKAMEYSTRMSHIGWFDTECVAEAFYKINAMIPTEAVIKTLVARLGDNYLQVLYNICRYSEAAADAVIKVLVANLDHEDSQVAVKAADTLGFLGKAVATDTVIKALVAKLDSKQYKVGAHATVALGRLCVWAAASEDSSSRKCAVEVLKLGAAVQVAASTALAAWLEAYDGYKVEKAVKALANLGPAIATEPVIKALVANLDRKLEFYHEKAIRKCSAEALGKLGPAAATEPVIKALVANLYHREKAIRKYSAKALGKLGPAATIKALSAIKALIANLDYKEDVIMQYCVEALGKLGPAAGTDVITKAWAAKLAAKLDDNSENSAYVAIALGNLGPAAGTDAVIKALVAKLENKFCFVRVNAIAALGKLGPAAATEPVIKALIAHVEKKHNYDYDKESQRNNERETVAETLGKLGVVAPEVVIQALLAKLTFVARLMNSSSVNMIIFEALGKIGATVPAITDTVIKALTAMWFVGDSDSRVRAALALGKLGQVAATNTTVLNTLMAGLMHEDDEVKKAAAIALGNLGPAAATEPVINALVAKLGDKVSSFEASLVRERSVEALGKFGAVAATSTVIKALVSVGSLEDEYSWVKKSATEALAKLSSYSSDQAIATGTLMIMLESGSIEEKDFIRIIGTLPMRHLVSKFQNLAIAPIESIFLSSLLQRVALIIADNNIIFYDSKGAEAFPLTLPQARRHLPAFKEACRLLAETYGLPGGTAALDAKPLVLPKEERGDSKQEVFPRAPAAASPASLLADLKRETPRTEAAPETTADTSSNLRSLWPCSIL